MNKNNEYDKFERGNKVPQFNKVNEMSIEDRFKVLDAQASQLKDQDSLNLYVSMRKEHAHDDRMFEQTLDHTRMSRIEQAISRNMNSPGLDPYISPRLKREQAENQALHSVHLFEERERAARKQVQEAQSENLLKQLKEMEAEQSQSQSKSNEKSGKEKTDDKDLGREL